MSKEAASAAARLGVERDEARGVLTLTRRAPRSMGLLLMGVSVFMLSPAAYLVLSGSVAMSAWVIGHISLWTTLLLGGAYALVRETTIVVDDARIVNTGRQGNLRVPAPIERAAVLEVTAARELVTHGNRAAEHWRVEARLRDGEPALVTRCFDEAEAARIAEEIDAWLTRDPSG